MGGVASLSMINVEDTKQLKWVALSVYYRIEEKRSYSFK